jgi:aspartate-semialdehyde dehydrogenase
MRVKPATPEGAPKVIFAALDASIAAEMEPRFADAGCAVITNSSALRMQKDVPLVIPEVNHEHVKLLECQAWRKKSGGFVVTNPNCSAIGLVIALAPLQLAFGLDTVMAVTMQAVSGAGYPGVASLDILGNVIPYISNEEQKMEEETQKLYEKTCVSLQSDGKVCPFEPMIHEVIYQALFHSPLHSHSKNFKHGTKATIRLMVKGSTILGRLA